MNDRVLSKLRPWHREIIDYLLANPTATLSEIAAEFGKTPAWISTIINTDMFQEQLEEAQDSKTEVLANDLSAKLSAMANISIEKITNRIEHTENLQDLLDSSKLALDALGLTSRSKLPGVSIQQNNQNNYYEAPVSAEVLERAQGLVGRREKKETEARMLPAGRDPQLQTLLDSPVVEEA